MQKLRKKGTTYKEISNTLGVSKWACITYLKDIEIESSAIEKEWKKAEKDSVDFLAQKGFKEIHDLNKICPTPYWDILAKRDNKWFLIDVTVSPRKQISGKIPYVVDNYNHAILFKNINTNKWKFVKISFIEEK